MEKLLDLAPFAENGFGVAAFDGGAMLGFLCSAPPFPNVFGSTGAAGVFSPLGANGAIGENRGNVYARLYQAAGEKWASAGAASHAVCLYAHDREAQAQFFRCGFGLRCVDAIRGMNGVAAPDCGGYTFAELAPGRCSEIYLLDMALRRHCLQSPFFMVKPMISEAEFLEDVGADRFFVVRKNGKAVAFLRAGPMGETFLRDRPGYIHAGGAFCLPEHRGRGLMQGLLRFAEEALKAEGYQYFGVDFESINPPAYGFWLKHFTPYAHSVTRRIDEGAAPKRVK